MTRLLAAAVVLALATAGCAGASEPGPTTTTVPARAAPSTAAPTPTTLGGSPPGWPEFASVQGGYRLRHPPGWRVKERAGDGGPVLSLLPPAGPGRPAGRQPLPGHGLDVGRHRAPGRGPLVRPDRSARGLTRAARPPARRCR